MALQSCFHSLASENPECNYGVVAEDVIQLLYCLAARLRDLQQG